MKLSMIRESIGTTTGCIATGVMPGFFKKKKKKKEKPIAEAVKVGDRLVSGYGDVQEVIAAGRRNKKCRFFNCDYIMKCIKPDSVGYVEVGDLTAGWGDGSLNDEWASIPDKNKHLIMTEAEKGANRTSGYLGISGQSQPTNSMTTVWTTFKSPPVKKTFEKKYAMKLPNPDERLLKQHRGKGY